jgi:hypothetical protein
VTFARTYGPSGPRATHSDLESEKVNQMTILPLNRRVPDFVWLVAIAIAIAVFVVCTSEVFMVVATLPAAWILAFGLVFAGIALSWLVPWLASWWRKRDHVGCQADSHNQGHVRASSRLLAACQDYLLQPWRRFAGEQVINQLARVVFALTVVLLVFSALIGGALTVAHADDYGASQQDTASQQDIR